MEIRRSSLSLDIREDFKILTLLSEESNMMVRTYQQELSGSILVRLVILWAEIAIWPTVNKKKKRNKVHLASARNW